MRIRALRSNHSRRLTGPTPPAAQVAATTSSTNLAPTRPTTLTKRSIEVLLRVERMMETATRGLATASTPQRGAAVTTPNTIAAADSGLRGN